MPLQLYQEKTIQGLSKVKNILAVAAGKGGVGKSTVAVNLALALKKSGLHVGLLDADVYGPSIRRMLPEDRLPVQEQALIIPALCSGIRMISMAYFRKEQEAAVVRAPIANGIIMQFLKQVEWGDLDYLLIDFPPGTGDIQLTLSQQANVTGALMVTTPQEVAVMDVRKAINMFQQVKVPIVGIIENMSYFLHEQTREKIYLFGKGGGERLADECGVPFLGQLPIDPEISRCGDMGKSIFKELPQDQYCVKSFLELSEAIIKHTKALKSNSEDVMEKFEMNWKEMGST